MKCEKEPKKMPKKVLFTPDTRLFFTHFKQLLAGDSLHPPKNPEISLAIRGHLPTFASQF